MSRGPDAATAFHRALIVSAEQGGCAVTIDRFETDRWSSATFTGARHQLMISAEAGQAIDAWLDALPEAELPVRHHLVADIVVTARRRVGERMECDLEALTVEDR